ncbi:MAG: hypothetical protein GF411_14120 [Candidatus Lokiarchaeota archaeon]|nr:hypothetical protein [Candidatus Lokiarchaeota archaeon]
MSESNEVIEERKDLTEIPGNPAFDGRRKWDLIMSMEDPEELAETLRNLFTGPGAGKSAQKQLENIRVVMGDREPRSGQESFYLSQAHRYGPVVALQDIFKNFILGAMGLGGGIIRREDLDKEYMMVGEDTEIEIDGKRFLLEKGDRIAVTSKSVVSEEAMRLYLVSGGDYGMFEQPVVVCNEDDLDDAIEMMRTKVDSVTVNPIGNPVSTRGY